MSLPRSATLDALRSCVGAITAMRTQIEQMRGMFDDQDGTIQEAINDGDVFAPRKNAALLNDGTESIRAGRATGASRAIATIRFHVSINPKANCSPTRGLTGATHPLTSLSRKV